MSPRIRKLIAGGLLSFVLVSVGFAIGQEVTRTRLAGQASPAAPLPAEGDGDQVVVYYMHASFRCVTCNTVESLAEQFIRDQYAQPLAAGRVVWRPVNYQQDEALARRYDVGGNMIVVVRFRDGQEVTRQRLDRVLALANDPQALRAYLREGIEACMAEESA